MPLPVKPESVASFVDRRRLEGMKPATIGGIYQRLPWRIVSRIYVAWATGMQRLAALFDYLFEIFGCFIQLPLGGALIFVDLRF